MPNPASERQVSFINSLIGERAFDGVVEFATLTSKQASDLIGNLLNLPTRGGNVIAVGMYRTADGEIYRVHQSRETGNLYAKVLTLDGFEYAQGAIRKLSASDKMTLEQAKAFGVETGMCCVCGIMLTDERSVANGIGPVCATKF